jgi:type I restriction enzyme M protein
MSKQYTCELCNKVFNQKIDFTRHKNKKAPCITIDKMQKLTQIKEEKGEFKTKLSGIFNYCLDVLRNNEHLTGDKALRTLAHLLDLRLIEHHFGNEIDIDTFEYDFSSYEDEIIEKHKAKLLKMVRFSNLATEKEENIPKIMKCLWDEILSVHPITKNIFLKGKGFDIQHQSTYKKLIDKLYTFDFEAIDEDILGEAYEEVIKDVMTGKVLGQFFTPQKVKQMMIKLIDPQLKADGTIEKIFDPAMGTGGFLISSLRHLLQQSKTKEIKMNWDFISNEGLGGREAEPDTYQLAISNMLISSGHMFNVLEKGDSIRNPITNKYDIILTNPPFGIDGLIYNEILHPLRNEYMPIKSNSAVPLFLQAIIHMLKINGRCAVVLPYGKEVSSKSNELINIREYLMKTCDLKEIIYLPSGVFTHTPIKTCVFYFVKKREGTDVLETKIKVSKTQKETGRDYKFSKTHQTTKVKFYDYNPYEDVKNPLVEVPIEKIASNSYSLNYAEYMKDETEEEQYEEGVIVKTLGEVCEFQNGSQLDKKDMVEGNIPIFGGGFKIVGFHNANNRNGNETIVCGTGAYSGYVNHNYGNPFWASQCFTMKSKNINIMIDKYLYYYSKIILEPQFMSNQKGTAIPFIRYTQVIGLKIPIPSLERQREIVKYLDFIYEKANKTSTEKIAELKKLNEFCLNNQKIFGENVVKELGKISRINPENMKSGQYTKINYIDIASVKGGQILELQKLSNDFPSRAKRIVKKGDILYSSVRPNLKGYVYISDDIQNCIASTGFAVIRVKEPNTILSKYLYYIMTSDYISDDLISKAKGAQYPAVSFDDFETIKIPIPSLERQQEIVEYCEYNDALIKQLEKEIENNKRQACACINSIVKIGSVEIDDAISETSRTCGTDEINEIIEDSDSSE